jgi:hypothetical protein
MDPRDRPTEAPSSEPNPQLAALDFAALVGRPVAEATATIEQAGGHARVVGKGDFITLDYRADRVTVVVENGTVVHVNGIG